MKKILFISAIAALFSSCDIINDPFGGEGVPINEPGTETVLRKVLIEEFTGHRCNNCPDAAAEIKRIQAIPGFGERVEAIAIHAGPSNFTGVNSLFPTDFTTDEGNEWASFFGVNGLPTGMVSRNGWSPTGNQHLSVPDSWIGRANDFLELEAEFKIEIAAQFIDGDSSKVSATISATPLSEVEGNHKLVVLITEDNIVASQRMPDYSRNETYTHQHVFRTTINGTWGEAAFDASALVGEEKEFTVSKENLLPEWKKEDLNIVAYIYSEVTQEIKQVEKLRL